MTTPLAALDTLCKALFALACLMTGAIVLIVLYDVASRNFGLPTAIWTLNGVEYLMLHITFLALPWLVRTRGHVAIEILFTVLPERASRRWQTVLHVLAALICFFMTWRSGLSFSRAWIDGSYEIRSFDAPMWTLFSTMPLGFFFGGLQFAAFPLRGESFYGGAPGEGAGL